MTIFPTQQDVSVGAADRPLTVGSKTSIRRKKRRIKGLLLLGRIFFFFLLYLGWPFVRKWLRPSVVFAVYGTRKEQETYWPGWLRRLLRGAFPIGVVRYGRRWGFVAATNITTEDFEENPKKALVYVAELEKEFPKAQVISLAGRLPGWVHRSQHVLQAPFVVGVLGTRYAMLSAARQAAEQCDDQPHGLILALFGGAGFTGSLVAQDTSQEFGRVIAFDPRYTQTEDVGRIRKTSDPAQLSRADVAVVLTGKGDDIDGLIPYLTPGTVVADDTHPCISPPLCKKLRDGGANLYKAVMRDGRMRMIPRMPNFRGDNIPGCLLEALVVLQRGRGVLDSPEQFFGAAAELGFQAELMRHPED